MTTNLQGLIKAATQYRVPTAQARALRHGQLSNEQIQQIRAQNGVKSQLPTQRYTSGGNMIGGRMVSDAEWEEHLRNKTTQKPLRVRKVTSGPTPIPRSSRTVQAPQPAPVQPPAPAQTPVQTPQQPAPVQTQQQQTPVQTTQPKGKGTTPQATRQAIGVTATTKRPDLKQGTPTDYAAREQEHLTKTYGASVVDKANRASRQISSNFQQYLQSNPAQTMAAAERHMTHGAIDHNTRLQMAKAVMKAFNSKSYMGGVLTPDQTRLLNMAKKLLGTEVPGTSKLQQYNPYADPRAYLPRDVQQLSGYNPYLRR